MIDGFGLYVASQTPTAWWRMNHVAGQTCKDEMGSGALMNGSGLVNESLVAGYNPDLRGHRHTAGVWLSDEAFTVTRTWTVAAWMKYEAAAQDYASGLGYERGGNSAYYYITSRGGDTYQTRAGVGNIGTGGPTFHADANWHLWVFCGGVNDTRYYKDATLAVSSGDTYDITASGSGSAGIYVGGIGNTGAGVSVGDVIYWDHQLSAGDVTALWAARLNSDIYAESNSPMVFG